MPRVAKVENRCNCGSKDIHTTSARLRLCECANGHKTRMSREVIALGFSVCACGEPFVPVCIFDRACLPGEDGEQAYREWSARNAIHGVLSDRSKKAARTREARRKAGVYAVRKAREEMPF